MQNYMEQIMGHEMRIGFLVVMIGYVIYGRLNIYQYHLEVWLRDPIP